MIFKNNCRNSISFVFQIISILTSWAASLLTGQDSAVLSQAIHHMQQYWDQAAQNIASSIGIISVPTPGPDAAAQVAEIASDPLAPAAAGSSFGN